MQSLEPEMEEFLLRIIPGLNEAWEGAAPEEIQRIEAIAGRPLPRFYRWFLTKMGADMGPLEYASLDFEAQTVLWCYEERIVVPDGRYLLIGFESNEYMPLHHFYDLNAPARDDALVISRVVDGEEDHEQFETFREMLAWKTLRRFVVDQYPKRCAGIISVSNEDMYARLDVIAEALGFKQAIPTGGFCRVLEAPDAAMTCISVVTDKQPDLLLFVIGAQRTATLRRILGALAQDSAFEIEISSWDPPPL